MRVQLNVVRGREAPQVLTVQAASVEDAQTRASQDGFTILAARAQRAAWRPQLKNAPGGGRVELGVFIEQLQSLLGAGLSVIEALTTLHKGASGVWAAVIGQLVVHLRQGQTLSQALALENRFPQLLVALVRSAELTSDLPQALGRFLDHEKRSAEVRHKLTSLAVYPMLLMSVGCGIVLFLLLYVMPRFARVFEGLSGHLPWSARAMVQWAHLLHNQGPIIFFGIAVLIGSVLAAWFVPELRSALLLQLLSFSAVQRRFHTYFLARWYRTTGMLVSGGIPLPQSVQLACTVLPPDMQEAGAAVERAMRGGLSPSEAFVKANMATPVAEQLLRAGERSGEVGHFLERVAQFHEAEVTRTLENTMRALEPIVMVLIGLGVGTVVILMYMPIFELASAIQ